jgi:hypothetical protein
VQPRSVILAARCSPDVVAVVKTGVPSMTETRSNLDATTIVVPNPADAAVGGDVQVHSAESVAAMARELSLFQPDWETMGRAAVARGVRRSGLTPRSGRPR